MLASYPKDNGVRNLFALIQGIRDAMAEGQEDAGSYHHDEGEFEDPMIPEQEGMDDDTDAYEESEEQECQEGAEHVGEEKEEPEPIPHATPRSLLRKKALRKRRHKRLAAMQARKPPAMYPPPPRRLESKGSEDDVVSPAPKLRRTSTEESYTEVSSPSQEEQLAELMAKISAVATNKLGGILASNNLHVLLRCKCCIYVLLLLFEFF